MYTLEDILDEQISLLLLLHYISQGYLYVFDLPFWLLLVGFESSLLMFQVLSSCNFQERPFKLANLFQFLLFLLQFLPPFWSFYYVFLFHFLLLFFTKDKTTKYKLHEVEKPTSFHYKKWFHFQWYTFHEYDWRKISKSEKWWRHHSFHLWSDVEYVFGLRHKQKSCLAWNFLSNGISHAYVQRKKNENDDVIVFVHFLTLSTFSGFVVSKKVVYYEISFPSACHMPMFRGKMKKMKMMTSSLISFVKWRRVRFWFTT